jgi:hypothetical protein
MKLLVPNIARYDPDQHLTVTELLTLMWLSNLERYMELHRSGMEMLAIPYPSWKLDPRRTAVAMLDYSGVCPDDLTAIEEILTQDSQAGSSISQDAVKTRTSAAQFFNQAAMHRHLQNHAYIHTSDFEVANTVKFENRDS